MRVEPPPRFPVVPPPLPPGWGRPPLVHRVPVLAAAGAALVLVGATLAWAALHPPERPATPAEAEVADASIVPAHAVAVNLPAPAPEPPAAPAQPPAPAEARHRRVKLAVQSFRAPAQPPAQAEPRPAGQTYGTRVTFLASPDEAMRVAQRERKLVFVLHVSGNFEEACFT